MRKFLHRRQSHQSFFRVFFVTVSVVLTRVSQNIFHYSSFSLFLLFLVIQSRIRQKRNFIVSVVLVFSSSPSRSGCRFNKVFLLFCRPLRVFVHVAVEVARNRRWYRDDEKSIFLVVDRRSIVSAYDRKKNPHENEEEKEEQQRLFRRHRSFVIVLVRVYV